VGWKTDRTSRPVLIGGIARFITNREGEIPSRDLISELLTFIRNTQGRPEAQAGCYDDRVMAFGIALQMHDSNLMPLEEEEPETEGEKTLQQKIHDIVTGKTQVDETEIDDLFITDEGQAWRDNY